MSDQYGGVSDFQKQAELASEWLTNVSQAAVQAGVTLTLSQALPSMLLAAAQLPAVTQVRVSERYSTIDSHQQWDIGLASLLPAALRIAPFKDTFWSQSKEPGYPHPGSEERNPILQALVATLSTGLVAVGDSADAIKSSLLAWCCRSDGVVLRPSTPAVAIDDHIVKSALDASSGSAATRHVWKSLSTISVAGNQTGVYHQGIIVAVNTSGGYKVTPEMIFPRLFKNQKNLRLWSVDSDNSSIFWQDFSQGHPLSFPKECWEVRGATLPCLFHVSTALTVHGGLTDVHLCGEVNKFVPLSPQRVLLVNVTTGVTLTLAGEPGETLTFDYYVNDQRRQNDVTIAPNGLATLALNLTWVTTTTTTTTTTKNQLLFTPQRHSHPALPV
ncbi:uncharacterized protein LOC112576251 [Pomacea canaliculata]|uniref:uncharacterized protein LOC112576251 n=1 Tax=Pomacea canaliculata TaxID=400727 RepID=UPI000D732EA3|nr:uncharacterized protein LOC112576251 [Pomacea canaliculata]